MNQIEVKWYMLHSWPVPDSSQLSCEGVLPDCVWDRMISNGGKVEYIVQEYLGT